MVIIQFPSGVDWYKSNWIFDQFAQDVVAFAPDDRELAAKMEEGAAFGALFLDKMTGSILDRTLRAMKAVAQRTLSGEIPGWKGAKPDDLEGARMYMQSISELLDMLKAVSPLGG